MTSPLRLLIIKESQGWPRSHGHDVHAFHMMKAFTERGHVVSLATTVPLKPQAIEALRLRSCHVLESQTDVSRTWPLNALQRKFANYFGVDIGIASALESLLRREAFDAVIVIARHLLPLFAVVRGPVRIWYPADDPAWHHLSRFKLRQRSTWGELKLAAINALYERAFRPLFDRVWIVSRPDRTAARLIAGCRQVDLIPNGVDADHYQPTADGGTIPQSAVFWGRLDFGPNVDALAWFLGNVWPRVRSSVPGARFDVFGFNPTPQVRRLAESGGVNLEADLPDLRDAVRLRQVVILPFVSGGGIKNKLLEAAALGMPIVCTPNALSGTKGKPGVIVVRTAQDWVEALGKLWHDPDARRSLGDAARRWVTQHHTWDAAAAVAEAGIRRSLDR